MCQQFGADAVNINQIITIIKSTCFTCNFVISSYLGQGQIWSIYHINQMPKFSVITLSSFRCTTKTQSKGIFHFGLLENQNLRRSMASELLELKGNPKQLKIID